MTVLLYGKEYWDQVLNFQAMVDHRVIGREDLELFRFVSTPEEAFRVLTNELKKNYPKDTQGL
jgi:predicted Rossmann-fold nucleotide-binding protein